MISAATSKCAACGKDGDNLKACTACKLVKYCNVTCQKAHRPEHKKECKKRAAEIFDEALFKEPPPNEECPVCSLPFHSMVEQTYKSCCGNTLCSGCIYAMVNEHGSLETFVCPFCREPASRSDEEELKRIKKRMELNDAEAFYLLSSVYAKGISRCIPQDKKKAFELSIRAVELGSTTALFNVGIGYSGGRLVKKDMKKAIHFWQLAAMKGSIEARHNLGYYEKERMSGNISRAMKHYMIAARAGLEKSLKVVQQGYLKGHVTKDDYEKTLRAYQKSQDEVKSIQRDKAAAYRAI